MSTTHKLINTGHNLISLSVTAVIINKTSETNNCKTLHAHFYFYITCMLQCAQKVIEHLSSTYMIFFGFFVYNFFFHCLTELMLCYFIQTACMNIYTCVVGDMISGHMTSGLDIWTPYIWTLQIAVCHGFF